MGWEVGMGYGHGETDGVRYWEGSGGGMACIRVYGDPGFFGSTSLYGHTGYPFSACSFQYQYPEACIERERETKRERKK